MKVLMVAPYRDGTGYGHAAIDTILAMDAAGIDVVVRPLKLNSYNYPLPARLQEIERKDVRGADYVIQYTLPSMMEYCGHFKKNIGMYCSETSNFNSSDWTERLNTLDVVWVANQQMVEAAKASHVKVPIKVIPYATNVNKFQQSYKKVKKLKDDGPFAFYTISELSKRKNFSALLQAFHTEFDESEPVSLVIKTHKYGMSAEECKGHVEKDCATIRNWLKLHDYKEEIIITDTVTDESLYSLHNSCDCFVLPSYGEAWSIPTFDAMGFGNTPIVTNWGGFKEYITNEVGWLVNCREEQICGITDSISSLYTSKETWASIDILHLRKCMREAYTNGKLRACKSLAGVERAFDFSYDKIGTLIKKELESYEH